jgi:hypothetical protein
VKSEQCSPFLSRVRVALERESLRFLHGRRAQLRVQYRRQAALGTSCGYVAVKHPLQSGLRVPAQTTNKELQ